MPSLDGRVVVITGAGRGLGREHALLAASEGARVVVNDAGCAPDGTGGDPAVAQAVADEIVAAGGTAVASSADVATLEGAAAVLALALGSYGALDGLVNNAGVLRDRMFVNMDPDDWDAVIRGHLRTTFCASRVAAAHWRELAKAGGTVDAAIVNTPSTSGLIGQVGQSNYGAAKAGIAAMTVILADELARYGVRVNGVVPVARTRMTQDVPQFRELLAAPADPAAFDTYHPGNVSPLVVWLLGVSSRVSGRIFYSKGGEIRQFLGWHYGATIERPHRWTVAELDRELAAIA